MGNAIYVTTPIYYPNDRPHLGHAYTTVLADITARWFTLMGHDTFLLTGTDEHGLKLMREAEKRGLTPKEFVDEMAALFKKYWNLLHVGYGRFIRTTDPDHEEAVKHALSELWKRGYIYKGPYRGWYCAGCEKYYTEKEYVVEEGVPRCPIHQTPLELLEEETYFLRLSQFRDYVLEILRKGDVVYPRGYAEEVARKIELEGLQDLSVARPKTRVSWGVELPFDDRFTVYVWIDALLNYLTGAGYPHEMGRVKELWSNAIQIIGKDILWFHTAVWLPLLAMLGLPPPKRLLVHAFLTVRGHKMGKSLGNVVSIDDMIARYGSPDAVRYIIARIANFEKDSEVSWELYDSIYMGELVNNYGNLVRRVTSLALRKLGGVVPRNLDEDFAAFLRAKAMEALELYSALKVGDAVRKVMELSQEANAYMNKKEPWREERPTKTLYTVLEAVRLATLFLWPIMPVTADKILEAMGIRRGHGPHQLEAGYVDCYEVKDSPIPFRRIEREGGEQ